MPSPGQIALVTGLVSSSYFAFANIGTAYFGVMPATARGQTTLPRRRQTRALGLLLRGCKASTVTSGLALSVSAYLTPAGPLRNILAAGSVAGYTVAIYTVFFMLPLNNRLIAILHGNSVKPMDAKQGAACSRPTGQVEIAAQTASRPRGCCLARIDDGGACERLHDSAVDRDSIQTPSPWLSWSARHTRLAIQMDCISYLVLQAEKMNQKGLPPN
ncbi:hypothetical protein MVEN_01216300 [Mycena venus]|uniref:Uncharacterized protein n=1 Tax=Mycena venus TaxID=2733690 RepID=A0A8H6Y4Z3_9AGAR|nr:hypothetical protein MVEN_01216300 [Mycena venus]